MEEKKKSDRSVEIIENGRGSTFWDFSLRLSESRKVRYAFYFVLFVIEEATLGYFFHRAIFFQILLPLLEHYYFTVPSLILFYYVGTRIFARWGRSKGVIVDDIRSNLEHSTYWIGEKRFKVMQKSGALVPLSSGMGVNRYWAYDCHLNEQGYPEKLRFAWFHHLSPANVHFTFEKYNQSLRFIDKLYDAVSLSVLNSSLAGRIHANEAFKQYDAAQRDALKISDLPFSSVEEVVKMMDDELSLESTKPKEEEEEDVENA